MKELIIKILHNIFGYEKYLELFSIFKIRTLLLDSRKSDFLFFKELLVDDANIIVVGACTGITTIPLVKKHPFRKAYAYEPLLSNFKALNKVIKHYKLSNVLTFNIGLGNKKDKREMILPILKGTRKQGMAHVKDPSILEYNEGISEFIQLYRMDDRAELLNIKINGIKVVAENFEYQIFEGAEALIQKNQPIIYCELWENEKRNLVINLMKSYNYDVYYRKKDILAPYHKDKYTGKNFFFKPRYA